MWNIKLNYSKFLAHKYGRKNLIALLLTQLVVINVRAECVADLESFFGGYSLAHSVTSVAFDVNM